VSKLASRQSIACTGDTSISGRIPEALTTTVEGLRKEEKWGMQKLADEWNEEGPTRTKQRESRYLHSSRQPTLSSYSDPCVQKCLKPSKGHSKKFLADIEKDNGCPSTFCAGYT